MKNIKLLIENNIATVSFSRPNAMNALNSETLTELNELLNDLSSDDSLKCLILTGEGKSFIAGGDIAEMQQKSISEAAKFSKFGKSTFHKIEVFPVPCIAAINGFALGGGLELAMACDFRIASDTAKFSLPEVNLGLIPGFAGTKRLVQLVGPAYAKYMLYTAEMIDAKEALRINLIQNVVPPKDLINEVMRLAKLISGKGPKAIRTAKRVLAYEPLIEMKKLEEYETEEFSDLFEGEAKEGMQAFLQKREPKWNTK